MAHAENNIKIILLADLLTKLFVLIINFARKLFFTEENNSVYRFIKAILKEYDYCKKMIKKHFNINLTTSAEEERFQLSNNCWICDKLLDVGDEKVRDHCHITGKYRGAAHWICNINLKLSKKIPVIFQEILQSLQSFNNKGNR